ncbi:unnamed protein product [Allacma fusca]|uniref:Uncharacterized protein n=1 Tax=Allacma fusca TaxID=39272 RepID=A0A8J2L2M3_9HEXA|nr:unnamed protein product [Allacma fusca]
MSAILPGKLSWMITYPLFQFVHMVFTSFPYMGEVSMNNYPVSDTLAFFATPNHSADFTAVVTGSLNRIRFGLTLRKNMISCPPGFVHVICGYIEEELEQLCSISL